MASGVLHLLQMVVEERCAGSGWLHSAQSMVGGEELLPGEGQESFGDGSSQSVKVSFAIYLNMVLY